MWAKTLQKNTLMRFADGIRPTPPEDRGRILPPPLQETKYFVPFITFQIQHDGNPGNITTLYVIKYLRNMT